MRARLAAVNTRTWASLRKHYNFRLFFAGQVVSLAGSWMQNIALAWYVVELTRSPLAVGVLALCRLGPFTLFGLFAGVLTDRLDNRLLLVVTQIAQVMISGALAFVALGGVDSVGATYALAFAGGIAVTVDASARQAFTFQMVGRDELPNAVALNVGLFNLSQVVGPAIAGVVIAGWGVGVCFLVNAASFFALLAAVLAMRSQELHAPVRTSTPAWIGGIREGFSYARHAPGARLILVTVAVLAVLSFNFQVLLPLLVSETLRAGPAALGLLSAVFGTGALVGALLSAALGRASWKLLVLGVGCFGVALLALAPLRAVSMYLWAFGGAAPLGGVLTGWLVHVGGTRLSLTVAGVGALAMAAFVLRRVPGRSFPAVAGSDA